LTHFGALKMHRFLRMVRARDRVLIISPTSEQASANKQTQTEANRKKGRPKFGNTETRGELAHRRCPVWFSISPFSGPDAMRCGRKLAARKKKKNRETKNRITFSG